MKKYFLFFALTLFVSVSLHADPAKKVNLKYNNRTLTVQVVHPVKDVANHFIEQIIVNVNGKDVKTLKFDKQSSKENAALELKIPEIKSGSDVKVTTRCNKFGKKTGKLKIK